MHRRQIVRGSILVDGRLLRGRRYRGYFEASRVSATYGFDRMASRRRTDASNRQL